MADTSMVRLRLTDYSLSFTWLITNLSKLKNIETDSTEVSAVFAGRRKGAKADSIIQASSELLDDYERKWITTTEN